MATIVWGSAVPEAADSPVAAQGPPPLLTGDDYIIYANEVTVQGNPNATVDGPDWDREWMVLPDRACYAAEGDLRVDATLFARWARGAHPHQYREVSTLAPRYSQTLQDLLNVYVYVEKGV